jgi:DNA polymerase zeta
VLSLVGADVRSWYGELPKPNRLLPQKRPLHSLALPPAPGGGGGGGGGGASGPACALRHAVVPRAWGEGGAAAAGALSGAGLGPQVPSAAAGGSHTIDSYYLSQHCAACDALTRAGEPLCGACRSTPAAAGALLLARAARAERQNQHLVRLCLHCGGGGGAGGGGAAPPGPAAFAGAEEVGDGGVACDSLDCGVFFERRKARREAAALAALAAGGLAMIERDARCGG